MYFSCTINAGPMTFRPPHDPLGAVGPFQQKALVSADPREFRDFGLTLIDPQLLPSFPTARGGEEPEITRKPHG